MSREKKWFKVKKQGEFDMSVKVMKTPRAVDLAITHQCDLRCKYCM